MTAGAMRTQVAIVGGGIGGVAAALSLLRAEFDRHDGLSWLFVGIGGRGRADPRRSWSRSWRRPASR
jgi:cation diffusion facilitator CzcD-associated flavoprotein CzcO